MKCKITWRSVLAVLCMAAAFVVLSLLAAELEPQKAFAADNKQQVITTSPSQANVQHVAGKWEKWKSGWYFKKKDGQYATGFIKPNSENRIYYLNGKGLMKTGWVKVKDLWYYANSNGSLYKGWLKWKGKWYYLDPKQAAHPAITGFFSDGKARYYCAPGSCAMKTGWIKNDEKWHWADSSGALQKGWKLLDTWYYLDPAEENYAAKVGYFKEGGKEYVTKSDCRLIMSNWAKISDSEERFASSSGALLQFYADRTDGLKIRKGKNGEYLSGWQQLDKVWFYLDPANANKAVSGEKTIDGKRYYFDNNYMWTNGQTLKNMIKAINGINNGWYVSVKGTTAIPDWLVNRINKDMLAIWNSGADVGFALIDVKSGATIAGNANKKFYSASTLKGPYVCALAQHWPSKAKNWKGTIKSTISVSSNEGYASLREAFGSGVMQTYMKEAGVSGISASSYYQNIKPKDLAKLWVRNYEYFRSGNSTKSWVKPYFKHTYYSFLDNALGGSYTVYSKPGWIWDSVVVYNDGGIVMKGDTPYIIVVMTSCPPRQQDTKIKKLVRDLDKAQGYIN